MLWYYICIQLEDIKICNNLATLRNAKGYTQVELSKLTNLSQQYISNVERCVIVPSISKAIILGECYCNIFINVKQANMCKIYKFIYLNI